MVRETWYYCGKICLNLELFDRLQKLGCFLHFADQLKNSKRQFIVAVYSHGHFKVNNNNFVSFHYTSGAIVQCFEGTRGIVLP